MKKFNIGDKIYFYMGLTRSWINLHYVQSYLEKCTWTKREEGIVPPRISMSSRYYKTLKAAIQNNWFASQDDMSSIVVGVEIISIDKLPTGEYYTFAITNPSWRKAYRERIVLQLRIDDFEKAFELNEN